MVRPIYISDNDVKVYLLKSKIIIKMRCKLLKIFNGQSCRVMNELADADRKAIWVKLRQNKREKQRKIDG